MGKRDFEALKRRRLKAAGLFARGKTQVEFPRFDGQFSYAANAAICAFSSNSIGVA